MKKIELSQGQFAIVDDCDFEEVSKYKWCADKSRNNGYYAVRAISVSGKSKKIYMHRHILEINDSKIHVDHINENKLDNRRSNIRIASLAENSRNRKKTKGRSSKYKGVTWFKRDSRWAAQINHNGKGIRLGYFENEIDAALAYNVAAKNLFGEFAKLNEFTKPTEDYANQETKIIKKRSGPARGVRCNNTKLCDSVVKEIRTKYRPHEYSSRKLAREYGISQSSVLRIVDRTTWRHVL